MAGPAAFFTWFRDKFVNLVLPLMPNSLQEIFLFIVMVVLIIVIVDLLIYTNIQRRIRNDSRCYQENKENQRSYGDYVAFIKTNDGDLIGTVSYDPVSGNTYHDDNCQRLYNASGNRDGGSTDRTVTLHKVQNDGKTISYNYKFICPGNGSIGAGEVFSGHTQYANFLKTGQNPPTR